MTMTCCQRPSTCQGSGWSCMQRTLLASPSPSPSCPFLSLYRRWYEVLYDVA